MLNSGNPMATPAANSRTAGRYLFIMDPAGLKGEERWSGWTRFTN
jgi:hypothetical protein